MQRRRPLVIRPSPRLLSLDWRERVRKAGLASWVAIGGLLIVGALRDRSLAGWMVTLVVVAVLIVIPKMAARINARILISEDDVVYRGPLRGLHACKRANIVTVKRVRLAVLGPRFPLIYLLFLDGEGRTTLPLPEEWWAEQDIHRVLNELGVVPNDASESLTPAEANARFPGSASFALVHRFAIAFVLLLIGLAVLGALVGPGRS